MSKQLFLIGFILLVLGVQLRLVKSFDLNEKTSEFIASKMPKNAAASTKFVAYDASDSLFAPKAASASIQSITPPRWLGWSFISVGATLVLTNPCFRK